MFFNVAFFAGLLLASQVLASPIRLDIRSTSQLSRLDTRRFEDTNRSTAGAVLSKSSGTISSVTGTLEVPAIHEAPGVSETVVSSWIGLDSANCPGSGFLIGLEVAVDTSHPSGQTCRVWTWVMTDAAAYYWMNVSIGDNIGFTISATGVEATTIATVENHTTGQSNSTTMTSPGHLCKGVAEWAVTSPVVPDFGTITFHDAQASGAQGKYPPKGADIFEMEKNDRPLTVVSTTESSVSVTYKPTN